MPDVPVCFETDYNEGYCSWTVSPRSQMVDDTFLLDGQTWFDLKPSMVLVPAKSWTAFRKAVARICIKYPKHCKQKNILEEIKK